MSFSLAKPVRTLAQAEPVGTHFRRTQTMELYTIVETGARDTEIETSHPPVLNSVTANITTKHCGLSAGALTYQLPVPDSRRHALMAACRMLQHARVLPDDGDDLRPYFSNLKRTTKELERELTPSMIWRLCDLLKG